MDFRLTEEQRLLQQTVRRFSKEELKPASLEYDAKTDPRECFPWELLKTASKIGLRTALLPVEYGGAGLDWVSRAVMSEELGAGDIGFGYAIYFGSANKLITLFSKEVVDEFIAKILEDDTFLLASSTTETEHGTDVHYLYDAPGVAVKTFAEKKGDEWVINGAKDWSTNSGIAKLYVISARTDQKGPLSQSMSFFLVPADTPGFSVGTVHDKLGCRLEMNSEIILEDVHVPARYLAAENKAWAGRERALNAAVIFKNAAVAGFLRAVYEEALNYAKRRVQHGKPIIEHPTVAVKLSEMRAQVEAARLLAYQCAWRMDNQQYDPQMGWFIKGYQAEIAPVIVNNALEIFGGAGQEKGMYIEKYARDLHSWVHTLGSGTIGFIKGFSYSKR
jgi:alkylation response protein AidB-like acyl-CoA dehydrogenase